MDTNLQKYAVFIKTVECGSFTKTAEALNYSQSGVSRMIRDLEKEWGTVLLERTKTGAKLTGDGMKLFPHIRSLYAEYEKLQMKVDELKDLQTGLIRIGTFSSVAAHWLPGLIKGFQTMYPNMDYELLLGDYIEIEEWIREGKADCGFLRLPAHSELETAALARDRLLAVLPRGHRLANMKQIPLAALCEEPFMLLEKGKNAEISEIFARFGLKPRIRFTTWDDYAIMSMVESGLGVSVLSELILKRIPYQIIAKELDVPAYREIGIAWRNSETVSPAVARFLEYLQTGPGRDVLQTGSLPLFP